MLIQLVILHIVALILKDACAVPIHTIDGQKDGSLRMYKLIDEYLRDKDTHKNIDQNKYTPHINDLGADKRGKYSWSVAYGKRDRWIAYGKRNSNQNGAQSPQQYMVPADAYSVSDNNEMKRQQVWRTRWGKKRTTVATHPTTRAMNNFDSNPSYEGYFTKIPNYKSYGEYFTNKPTTKRQQWSKFQWGKRSF